jgi:RecD/TraA family predicted helicase
MSHINGTVSFIRNVAGRKVWIVQVEGNPSNVVIPFAILPQYFVGVLKGAHLTCRLTECPPTDFVASEVLAITVNIYVPIELASSAIYVKALIELVARKEKPTDKVIKTISKLLNKLVKTGGEAALSSIFRNGPSNDDDVSEFWEQLAATFERICLNYKSLDVLKCINDAIEAHVKETGKTTILSTLTPQIVAVTAKKVKEYSAFKSNPYLHVNHGLCVLDAYATLYQLNKYEKCRGTLVHLLRLVSQEDGHTCYPKDKLFEMVYAQSSVFKKKDVEFIEDCLIGTDFTIFEHGGRDIVYLQSYADMEEAIVTNIKRIFTSQQRSISHLDTFIRCYELKKGVELHVKQTEAIHKIFTDTNILLLIGGAGSGKSSVTDCIKYIWEESGQTAPIVCAPTGKAARRIDGMTIHKTLGWSGEDKWTFNASYPLESKLIIVDECSMIDIDLAFRLFSAINDGCKVILVGDPNQLPSVGPGRVFASLIQSKYIPVVKLTKCFRNGGNILHLAESVKSGEGNAKLLEGHDDVIMIKANDEKPEEIRDQIKQIFTQERLAAVQIIVPTKTAGVSTSFVNDAIHKMLYAEVKPFVCGNRVIVTKNDSERDVYNGDIGEVADVYGRYVEVAFVSDNPKAKPLKLGREDIELAYGITIHKSQGSEYDVVILVLHKSHGRMLNKQLLYTAVTRAKKKLYLITSGTTLMRAMTTNLKKRYSLLENMFAMAF